MKDYKYIPAIGKRVKFKEWCDYSSRSIHIWAWLEVIEIYETENTIKLQLTNGPEKLNEFYNVPLNIIEKPIGWRKQYAITVEPEKVDTVLGWLQRGIAVRQCHDLSSAGNTTFQPGDNYSQPHWAYPELTDLVLPEDTKDRIKIVKLEFKYDASIPDICQYCKGTGYRIAEEFHVNNKNIPDPPQKIGDKFKCFTCKNGIRDKFISEIVDKKEKQAAIKKLTKEGWKVQYRRRYESGWFMERETIIKDFGDIWINTEGVSRSTVGKEHRPGKES